MVLVQLMPLGLVQMRLILLGMGSVLMLLSWVSLVMILLIEMEVKETGDMGWISCRIVGFLPCLFCICAPDMR